MLYRKMKKTGDELSVLGFGAMRLPEKQGKINEDLATRQIRLAIDKGVNFVDTAWTYHNGASEPFLGRALAGGYRKKVRLSTKLPFWLARSREDMQRFLSAQLDRLRTDVIDYYLVHSMNGETWKNAKECGVIDFLNRAKQEGRILHAGFSFHGDKDSFRRIVDEYDWEFCLLQYNYLDEHSQAGREGLQYAAAKDLGVIIMEPLRGGNLTNRVPSSVQSIWEEAETKRSPAEWALRWVWNHPEVSVLLSGMNEDAHIEENIRIAGAAYPNSLEETELELVRRVGQEYRKLMRIGCTGCGYCMPCPVGVNIPLCFDIYNGFHLGDGGWKEKLHARIHYLSQLAAIPGMRSGAQASLCKDCGKCADACPQSLPIAGLLKDVGRELEDSVFRMLYLFLRMLLPLQRRSALRLGRKAEKKEFAAGRNC